MNDTQFSKGNGSGCHAGFYSFAAGFSEHDLYAFIIDVVVNGSGCITAAAYTGYEVIRTVASFFSMSCFLISSLMTDCKRATMSG